MAKLYPFQQSFATGQISPFLAARSDLEMYQEGVQTLQNFVPDSRGPIRLRNGTRFLAKLPDPVEEGQRVTIIPLDLANLPIIEGVQKHAVLVLTGFNFYFYWEDGELVTNVIPQTSNVFHITDPDQCQYAVHPENTGIYLVNPNIDPQLIEWVPLVTDPQDYKNGYFQIAAAPLTWMSYGGCPPAGDFFPAAVCFYQGRLWFGGTAENPMTFYGSYSGSFNDFGVPQPVIEGTEKNACESDIVTNYTIAMPVEYGIADDGQIRWMVGQRTLLVGTDYGEYTVNNPDGVGVVGGAENLPDIMQQSAFGGSKSVQPRKIGQGVFFVTSDSERLRDVRYQWTANGYLSNDVSFLFKGSTSSRGLPVAGRSAHFIDMAYSENPFSMIWLIDADGGMIGCAYEMITGEKSVFGWSTHPTQFDMNKQKYTGKWKAVAVTKSEGNSETWAIADRNDAANTGSDRYLYLEKGMLPDEEVYVDSYESYHFNPKFNELPEIEKLTSEEFPHLLNLQGQTIRVLVFPPVEATPEGLSPATPFDPYIELKTVYENPAVYPMEVVPAAVCPEGKTCPYDEDNPDTTADAVVTIKLPKVFVKGTKFIIGLPYKGKMVTLPMDKVTNAGSAMAYKKRWNKIILRVYDSAIPRVSTKASKRVAVDPTDENTTYISTNPGQLLPAFFPDTPMGMGQPLQTNDLVYRNLDWDLTGRIYITQDEPMKTTILGIFGETVFETL